MCTYRLTMEYMTYYVYYFVQAFNEEVKTDNGSFIYLRCDGAFIRMSVGNILVFVSYVFGFYIFRYSQREHLSTLTEKVRSY